MCSKCNQKGALNPLFKEQGPYLYMQTRKNQGLFRKGLMNECERILIKDKKKKNSRYAHIVLLLLYFQIKTVSTLKLISRACDETYLAVVVVVVVVVVLNAVNCFDIGHVGKQPVACK